MVIDIIKFSRASLCVGLLVGLLVGGLALSGCSSKQSIVQEFGPPPQLSESQMELYSATCASCHESVESGSPQKGNAAAWDVRWEKGMHGLLQNTVNGLNGMPALGTCSSCTQKDFQVFIEFMSGRTVLPVDKNNQ